MSAQTPDQSRVITTTAGDVSCKIVGNPATQDISFAQAQNLQDATDSDSFQYQQFLTDTNGYIRSLVNSVGQATFTGLTNPEHSDSPYIIRMCDGSGPDAYTAAVNLTTNLPGASTTYFIRGLSVCLEDNTNDMTFSVFDSVNGDATAGYIIPPTVIRATAASGQYWLVPHGSMLPARAENARIQIRQTGTAIADFTVGIWFESRVTS